MAEPLRRPAADVPEVDPAAVDRAYRFYRERRRAEIRRRSELRKARVRFWIVLLVLLGLVVYFSVLVWSQVERLFGL